VKTGGAGSTYPTSESGVNHDYGAAGHDVVGTAPAPAAYTDPNHAGNAYGSQPGMGGTGAGYTATNDYADSGVGRTS
jgi:hypothetical protein